MSRWPIPSIPGSHEPVIRDNGVEVNDPLDSTFGVEVEEDNSEWAWLEWDRAIATMALRDLKS